MKKGDIRKQEIIETAESLFCRYGYENTSIQNILDQLRISKGSFYHHYISKESLLEGICRKRAEQIYSSVTGFISEKASAAENLDIILSGMIPFRDEKLSFLLMLLPVFQLPEGRIVRMSYCDELLAQFKADTVAQLINGHKTGELICQTPEISADLILSMVNRLWCRICDIIFETEKQGNSIDISELLRYTDCYRTNIERMLTLPFGSVNLIDIPTFGALAEQIHNHWKK